MFNFIAPKLIFKVEKWKWNKEFRMYVSNMGHLRDEHKQPVPIKIAENGYVMIKTRNGFHSVHRLVMKTWMPTEDMDNLTVDHLDHNKRNNTLENLEWVTKSENQRRAKEDFIPFIINQEKRKNAKKTSPAPAPKSNEKHISKAEAKKMRNACPQRYKNPNLTENDLLYYINGIECPDIDTAIETAKVIFENCVNSADNKAGPQLEHWSDEVIRSKLLGRLESCRHFHPDAIDGIKHMNAFKYIEYWVKVKEDVQ